MWYLLVCGVCCVRGYLDRLAVVGGVAAPAPRAREGHAYGREGEHLQREGEKEGEGERERERGADMRFVGVWHLLVCAVCCVRGAFCVIGVCKAQCTYLEVTVLCRACTVSALCRTMFVP